MTRTEDVCATCGAYVDPMNGEAVERTFNFPAKPNGRPIEVVWCGIHCYEHWGDLSDAIEAEGG